MSRHARGTRAFAALALFLGSLLPAASLAGQETPTGSADLAFLHVHLVDVKQGRVIPDQTVVVRDGEIANVAPTATSEAPSGAVSIDASGMWMIPGLWDMHAHLRANGLPAWVAPTGSCLCSW